MNDNQFITQIRGDGTNSRKITVTDCTRKLGLEIGDYIKVTIERVE